MVGIQVQGKDDGWIDEQMDGWTHTHNLCNHDNIYTDIYVHQYIIPHRVITIIYPGENSAKSKALTCARARAGVCACAGENVNKL